MIIVYDYSDNECKMLINLQICIYFGNIIVFDCKNLVLHVMKNK